MSHALSHHFNAIHHHGKKHMYAFRIKHNVGFSTILLLFVLALQINLLYLFSMMPIQSSSTEVPMSFAGSTLEVLLQMFQLY